MKPGKRLGAWVKLRFNCRQEFVVGGYTPSYLGLDALLVGFYKGKELRFAGAVRSGFTPTLRREVQAKIGHLETAACPFVNLPDRRPGAWGQGITKEKMSACIWVKPTFVAEIEFAEWTPDGDGFGPGSDQLLRALYAGPLRWWLLHPHAASTGAAAECHRFSPFRLDHGGSHRRAEQSARSLSLSVDPRQEARVVVGDRFREAGRDFQPAVLYQCS